MDMRRTRQINSNVAKEKHNKDENEKHNNDENKKDIMMRITRTQQQWMMLDD